VVARLRDARSLNDHYAWDITEGLTTEVGQRLAGTEAEARARDWAVAKSSAMGFANVRVEPFDMPVWVRGAESAEIVAPFPQKLVVAALGNSGSTGPPKASPARSSPSTASTRSAPRPTRGARQDRVRRPPHDAGDQDGSATASSARRAARARPSPAEGRDRRSSSARSAPTITATRTPASMTFADGAADPGRRADVPDAEQLVRILKRGKPVTMRLTLESSDRTSARAQSGNVIAEVPGRDPEPRADPARRRPSRQLGPGHRRDRRRRRRRHRHRRGQAHHGCRPPAAHHPHRLVRRRGAGLFGGNDYLARTARSRITPSPPKAISAPTASGRSTASSAKAREARARAIGAALAPLGIVTGSFDEADGSDIGPMLAAASPASAEPGRHPLFRHHHTPDDTLDKIDPAQLRQNVAAWTAMLAVLSGGIEEPKRARKRR
jgi:carboxypeptidase Q